MKRVFADTSYFIALIAPNDAAHQRASALSGQPMRLVVTAWVMTELAAFLSAPANRGLFSTLLASLRASAEVEFVDASAELFDRGAALYAARPDKAWSLVDCISFVVMNERSLTDALTTDHHFVQAGFNAMLTDDHDKA